MWSSLYTWPVVSSDGSLSNEIDARISKARIASANLRHLWHHKGISLSLKGRVYKTTLRAVLLYGSVPWPLRVEDLKRLQVFDNRCFRSIAGVGWCQRIHNETVRKRVFGHVEGTSISDCIQHNRLRWLGHVLRMPGQRLPKKVLLSMPDSERRKPKGGQSMTWQKGMNYVTRSLGSVGLSRLPVCGTRDPPNARLKTLPDMAANWSQWRMCFQSVSRSSD